MQQATLPGTAPAGAVPGQTGAEWMLRAAAGAGMRVCFANPGTTELPFVAALEKVPQIRPVLGLFEGVCSGAADGYYRIAREPALVLTHLGPGFANSIANLHNARRARSAILNVIGDHMSWHVQADPPLHSDIASLAAPVSAQVLQAGSAGGLQQAMQAALQTTLGERPGIATVVLPMDVQSAALDAPLAAPPRAGGPAPHDAVAVDALARRIRQGERVLLLLGDNGLHEPALRQAARLAGLPNVSLVGETFPARSEHGRGLPAIRRLAYLPEQAHPYLLQFDQVALVGALHPVAFFGAEHYPSRLGDATRTTCLAGPGEACEDALRQLADALSLPARATIDAAPLSDAGLPETLTPQHAARVLAAHLPAEAIVSMEGGTLGFPFNELAGQAERHSTIVLTGGAIGQGLPSAFGASLAAPGRKVVALQSDGSAMFTCQALWSMARESADVVVVIAANRRYQVLRNEMSRNGYALDSTPVQQLLSLSGPDVDWTGLARSMGVPACRADTVSALRRAYCKALAEPGPFLIEALLP